MTLDTGTPTEDAESVPIPEQRQLLGRILVSPKFRKSPKLSSLLTVICEQTWAGKARGINEQLLGVLVFERREGYSVGDDSIVRSQARFLRQRLEEYFAQDGVGESIILSIPKGSYLPVFSYRSSSSIEKNQDSAGQRLAENIVASTVNDKSHSVENRPSRWLLLLWLILTVVLLIVTALSIDRLHRYKNVEKVGVEKVAEDQFWGTIFAPDRPRIIVVGDSSLVFIEGVTGVPVHLSAYLNKTFLEQPMPSNIASIWALLKEAEYTSMPDLNIATLLIKRAYTQRTTVQTRYASDLTLQNLRESNAILIGGALANPWVELFDAPNRFHLDYDPQARVNYVSNPQPQAGEEARYNQTDDIAYGVLAYLPSVDGQGSTLLVKGTNRAGTDASGEFLFSTDFSAFLQSIAKGGIVPHFQILLSAQNTNGGSHHVKIVCQRTSP